MPLVRRERDIEASAVRWARAHGWLALKIGSQGWPDRLFVRQGHNPRFGRTVYIWVEFKRPGEKLAQLQQVRRQTLEAQGCEYAVVHSTEELQEVLGE